MGGLGAAEYVVGPEVTPWIGGLGTGSERAEVVDALNWDERGVGEVWHFNFLGGGFF